MERIKPRTLSGFMELLPGPQLQFERMLDTLRRVYALYGFTPLDTPVLEAAEILLAKGGGETEKQIYRFQKGEHDLAMRFDLTVPLAKYVALHAGELSFPFRRFQIGKVYRGERAQRGRFREFYQADIDVIGDGELDIRNEAEIPSVIYQTFTALGLRRFVIRINNRKLLGGLFALLGLGEDGPALLRIVDKLDKIGPEQVRAQLIEASASPAAADGLLGFIAWKGDTAQTLAMLEGYRGRDARFDQGLDELSAVAGYLRAFGVPDTHFAIDLTIARGLDYYTGTVYETTMTAHPEIGSICSGGRYDDLAGYYTGRKLPGVGISIGVTRLFYVLGEQGLLADTPPAAPADVLVIPMDDALDYPIRATTALRAAGIRTQLYCESRKLKAKIAYADKLHIPYAVFIGEQEAAEGSVTIKDLRSGEQRREPLEAACARLSAALAAQTGSVIADI